MVRMSRHLANVCLAMSVAMVVFVALRATAFELVGDLNLGQPGKVVYAHLRSVDVADGTLLAMEDPARGTELWFTDNTSQGTRLVKDINQGPAGSGPDWYSRLGDLTVFLAHDGVHGIELWRTDGTASGTYLLADIGPGPQHWGGPYPTAVLDGVLYFAADDGVSGNELWRTDGTREGTYLVADIVPGYEGSYPTRLAASTSHIFIGRDTGVWVSDGTSQGTRKIADLNQFRDFKAVGNAVFFPANDGVHGYELWRADADGGNVQMVANLNTQPTGAGQDGSSDPSIYFTRGNSVFLLAQTPLIPPVGGAANDCRLYRVDAAGGGVTELFNFQARCHIDRIINLPAGSLFRLWPSGAGDIAELWITDGTAAGTVPLDLNGLMYAERGAELPFNVAYGTGGEAYFFGRMPGVDQPDKVWRTDGTRAGTRVFADLTTSSARLEIAWLNGRVYFDTGASTHSAGDELWTSDGTSAGTFLVRDIRPFGDSQITNLRVSHGRLQFFASRTGDRELWSSDGTLDGTVFLANPTSPLSGNTADSNVVFAGQIDSRVVFAATRGGGAEGRELFISDGSSAGTSVVRDINTGGSSDPDDFLILGNQLLFVARDWDHGRELWRTDGSSAGTILLADIVNGDGGGNVTLGGPSTILDGVVYFTAGPTLAFPELWRSDGTTAGTFKVPGTVGARVVILGGNGTHILYQAMWQGSSHLWSWNGSQAQIIAAADSLRIVPRPGVTFDGRVCFRAWEVSPQRVDVWCANGQQGDLLRLTNLASLGLSADDFHPLGNKLLVNAPGSGASAGLYATQGLPATAQRISSRLISNAKSFGNGQLVFAAVGGGLMMTDGTTAGTRDLVQGVSLPGEVSNAFGVLGNYVVFRVHDIARGTVMWRTDGTASGTRYVADFDRQTIVDQVDDSQFFTLGDRLLCSGRRLGIGNELWSMNATDPNASDDTGSATGGIAYTVAVLENDADFDGTLNPGSVSIVASPAHGVATVNEAGAIVYTAVTSYSGLDMLTYRVSDNQGRHSNVATVYFNVVAGSGGNPPPANPPPSGGGGGGGALGIEVLWLLLLVASKPALQWLRWRRLASR